MADEGLGVLQVLLCGLCVEVLGVPVHADQPHIGALPRLQTCGRGRVEGGASDKISNLALALGFGGYRMQEIRKQLCRLQPEGGII